MISRCAAMFLLGASIMAMAAAQLLAKVRIVALFGADTGRSWLANMGVGLADPLLWVVALLVMASATCWYLAMTHIPVSTMVPIASILAPLVAIGAFFLLGEQLTDSKLAAIALIMAGVAWLAVQDH